MGPVFTGRQLTPGDGAGRRRLPPSGYHSNGIPVSHAVRYVNDELTRASEAIIRSARAPQPRSQAQAQAQATAAEDRKPAAQRVDRAA
jgi:hypothetical protein